MVLRFLAEDVGRELDLVLDAILRALSLTRLFQQLKIGGESGIRTHGRVSPTHAFQACSFNHSDISPLWNQRLASGQTSDYRTPSAKFMPLRHHP